MSNQRDHGGGLDAAIQQFGGTRRDWLDLSTGINPIAYPIPEIPAHFWQSLPDSKAQSNVLNAARAFWQVPETANIIAASGVSQLIAMIPSLLPTGRVEIIAPTYNEHAAAFRADGWHVGDTGNVRVIVHPNNPDGRLHNVRDQDIENADLIIIDESFCDVTPDHSLIELATLPNVLVLKGLGKFWGLAGLRLGFAIGTPDLVNRITEKIGPWAISGPAQHIGHSALSDKDWANQTRARLSHDSARLDQLMISSGAGLVGGTDLFRLYDVGDASKIQNKLAKRFVWTRIFPYSNNWIRLGLPGTKAQWTQLSNALEA